MFNNPLSGRYTKHENTVLWLNYYFLITYTVLSWQNVYDCVSCSEPEVIDLTEDVESMYPRKCCNITRNVLL